MNGRLIGAVGLGLVAALTLGWWLLGDSGGQVADVARERPAVDALQPRAGRGGPPTESDRRKGVVAEARRTLELVRDASEQARAAGVPQGVVTEDPVDDGGPEIHPMTREGVRAAVSASTKEIQQCYETLLQSYPDTSGRIDVTFEIEGMGDHSIVSGAEVRDETLNSRYMTGCVLTAMEDISFEAAEEGKITTVSWPFVFKNGG